MIFNKTMEQYVSQNYIYTQTFTVAIQKRRNEVAFL